MTLFPYDINKAIIDHLKANWTYTSIREINKDDNPDIPFIECYFKPGMVIPLEIKGAGERVGVFMINIYTKKGAGVDAGLAYAGKLEEMFWHKDIGGVVCENESMMPYTEHIGIDKELEACHHQFIMPFSAFMEI